ncbi:MAG: RNA methyltransferase [Clostridia bacterium]|nr:RNA methyltransferase [Clostridia bacterium]
MKSIRITSRTNQLIIDTSKLKDKKYRDENSLFAFEGIKLFKEAVSSKIALKNVFVSEECTEATRAVRDAGIDHYIISESVYDKLSIDKSPDGILCTCDYLFQIHNDTPVFSGNAMILCDIQDPGNLGTCIRSARAFGINELILTGNCADIYNRRCIRAAMGALFRQKISRINDPLNAIEACRSANKKIIATALRNDAKKINEISIDDSAVFAIGNEGHGLSDNFISNCDECVIIPMKGDTESLNAAIASSIIMWEVSRR